MFKGHFPKFSHWPGAYPVRPWLLPSTSLCKLCCEPYIFFIYLNLGKTSKTLYGGNHPANYRWCSVHKDLEKIHNDSKNILKKNVSQNIYVNEGKSLFDKTSSDPSNFNPNDNKTFPNLSHTHFQNHSPNTNSNQNSHTHNQAWIKGGQREPWPRAHNGYQTIVGSWRIVGFFVFF
jgi:hypothetical protein